MVSIGFGCPYRCENIIEGEHMKRTLIAVAACLGLASAAKAVPILPGTYDVANHPDGNQAPPTYFARLDGLHGQGVFLFNAECGTCDVVLDWDGSTARIHGTAQGGHKEGDHLKNDDFLGLYEFDFTYPNVVPVPGDEGGFQDIWQVEASEDPLGTLSFGEDTWALRDKSNGTFSFRFGDEDDGEGHRGFDGLSGWGWLQFRLEGYDEAFQDPDGSQDGLFTGERRRMPVPATPILSA